MFLGGDELKPTDVTPTSMVVLSPRKLPGEYELYVAINGLDDGSRLQVVYGNPDVSDVREVGPCVANSFVD